MAIAFESTSGWVFAASGSIVCPSSAEAADEMMIVRVAYKSSAIATCSASTATSGWAKLGEFHDGTTNSGNGTGSVAVAVFWKIAAGTSETYPTIDFSQTVTQIGICSLVYSKTSGTWDTPVGDGGGFAASTSVSATIQSHVSVASGDLVDFFYGARDDSTATVPTITQSGVTFDTVAEQPATAGTDTSGADGAYDGGYRLATAGTSSAAAVITGTLSTSESGSGWMTRLRTTAGVTVTPGTASLTTTRFAPTVTTPRLVTPGTASLTTTRFAPSVVLGTTLTPGVGTLTLTAFAPTVTATDHKLVTPGLATLTLTPSAPTVTVTGGGATVTPGAASLALTAFAPTVTAGAGLTLIPGVASLTLTTFAPTVQTPRTVTPGTASLSVSSFAPTVLTPRLVTPQTASLVLSGFAPTVSVGGILVGGFAPDSRADSTAPQATVSGGPPRGKASSA